MPARFYAWLGACLLAAALGGCRSTPGSADGPSPDAKTQPAKASRGHSEALSETAEAHARYAAGVSRELNEDSEKALEEFWLAANADPSNEALVLEVSRRLIQRKSFERAGEILQKTSRRPEATGMVFAQLGLVYAQTGRTNQAIEAGRTAIHRSPSYLPGYFNLFSVYLRGDRSREALAVLDQAAQQPDTEARFQVELASLFQIYGPKLPAPTHEIRSRILTALDRAVASKPQSPNLLQRIADGYAAQGESARAAAVYLTLLGRFADAPPMQNVARAKLVDLYLKSDDKARALEQLQALASQNAEDPEAMYQLATVAMEADKPEQAVEYFNKSIALRPEFEQAYFDLASLQLQEDQAAEALQTLEAASGRFPKSFLGEYLSALCLNRLKRYGEAVVRLKSAEAIASQRQSRALNHLFHFQMAVSLERQGDFAEAERYFRKCVAASPDFAEALNYLGYMWADRGENLDEAKTLIEKAVKLQPKNAAYLDSLGWVLFKLGQTEEALKHIAKAIELTEEPDATLFDHLGDIELARKRTDAAREAWKKSLAIEPNPAVQRKLDALPH